MAECEIYVRPAELDTDPFALNFLNGTVDLRTGEMREHRRSDFITKARSVQIHSGGGMPTMA